MSELAIQQGLQTAIQAMSEFADADVVLNDWSVFDQSSLEAPYVVISNADEFESRQDTTSEVNRWTEILTLIERFTNWKETLDNFRTRRQALLDMLNTVGTARSAGGLEAVTIDVIRADGPILPKYDPYVVNPAEAVPIFLYQDIAAECEEF